MMTLEEAIRILQKEVDLDWFPNEKTEALKLAISALRPVSREQVEKVRSRWVTVAEVNGKQYSKCAACQMGLDGLEDAYLFCPHCGAPMTDEAVEMVMERLEALHENRD